MHRKYCSKDWFNLSVCPWGFKEVLILIWTLSKTLKSLQNALVKTGSLSVISLIGSPWSLYTFSRKSLATPIAVYGSAIGIQCPYLVNLSIMTKIPSLPSALGKPVIKSMLTVFQAPSGTVIGSNNPGSNTFPPCSIGKHDNLSHDSVCLLSCQANKIISLFFIMYPIFLSGYQY